MIGERAKALIDIERGDCILLGTAPVEKRSVHLYAFSPDEIRIVARHLLQAADMCEGKPQPKGRVVFLQDESEAA